MVRQLGELLLRGGLTLLIAAVAAVAVAGLLSLFATALHAGKAGPGAIAAAPAQKTKAARRSGGDRHRPTIARE